MNKLYIHEDGVVIPLVKNSCIYSQDDLMRFMKEGDLYDSQGSPAKERDIKLFLR